MIATRFGRTAHCQLLPRARESIDHVDVGFRVRELYMNELWSNGCGI